MNNVFRATICLILLYMITGCAPRLAKVPYTELEQKWIDYLEKPYPSWTPPQTIPPVNTEKATEIKTRSSDLGVHADADILALPPTGAEKREKAPEAPIANNTPETKTNDMEIPTPETLKGDDAAPKGTIVNVKAQDLSPASSLKKDTEENISHPVLQEKYTVQKGDTLWRIAEKVYKDGKKWRLIYEFNKDIIRNPDLIPAGMVIKIPSIDNM